MGEDFDPAERMCVVELERDIGGAKERARAPQQLPSAARLGKLRALSAEQLNAADEAIEKCITEAKTLSDLAKDPSRAARIRLYAHVASWIADHPGEHQDKDNCVVCGGALTNLAGSGNRKANHGTPTGGCNGRCFGVPASRSVGGQCPWNAIRRSPRGTAIGAAVGLTHASLRPS